MRFISVAHRLTCTASDAKLSVGTERANFYKKILRAENKKRSHKKRTRDLWNTRREIQTQTKLDQPSYWQHQTPETRPQLQTSRKKRSWTLQETMATRRCREQGKRHNPWRRRRRRKKKKKKMMMMMMMMMFMTICNKLLHVSIYLDHLQGVIYMSKTYIKTWITKYVKIVRKMSAYIINLICSSGEQVRKCGSCKFCMCLQWFV